MAIASRLRFFSKPFPPALLWFGAAVVIPIIQYLRGSYNNYKIFKGVFYHTWHGKPLYAEYPAEYFDTNHYGPFFSVVIAPFALMPDVVGMVLWSIFNTWILYKAIMLLPLDRVQKTWILWIAFIELTTTQHNLQSNSAVAAWIILAYVFIVKRKELWAGLFILVGFFVKIYGIAALALGVFAERKGKLILSLLLWFTVLFALPMVLSSPQFVIQGYKDWAASLMQKNISNIGIQEGGNMQNISVIGMISRIFYLPNFPNLAVLIPAAFLMLAPLVRFNQYSFIRFQLYYLSAILLSVVLFSTGSESSTYIVALSGAAIFFVIQPRPWNGSIIFLLIFMMLLTSLSPIDIFPKVVRTEFIRPYALKALPPFLIWITIIYTLLTKKSFNEPAEQ